MAGGSGFPLFFSCARRFFQATDAPSLVRFLLLPRSHVACVLNQRKIKGVDDMMLAALVMTTGNDDGVDDGDDVGHVLLFLL